MMGKLDHHSYDFTCLFNIKGIWKDELTIRVVTSDISLAFTFAPDTLNCEQVWVCLYFVKLAKCHFINWTGPWILGLTSKIS